MSQYRSGNRLKPIGVAMSKPAKALALGRGFRDQTILEHWKDYVGEEIARLCVPHEFKYRRNAGAVLTLNCLGAHASELAMRKEEILMRINHGLGFEAVANIVFRHQDVGFDAPTENATEKAAEKKRRKKAAQNAVPSEITGEIQHAENEELRGALEKFSRLFYNQ